MHRQLRDGKKENERVVLVDLVTNNEFVTVCANKRAKKVQLYNCIYNGEIPTRRRVWVNGVFCCGNGRGECGPDRNVKKE